MVEDGNDWSAWIGRRETKSDTISVDRARDLAATLDVAAPDAGAPLPAGWHWIYFNALVPRDEVGLDGHPRRGGFLPPVPLPRRMWAGGRLDYVKPLTVGEEASRISEIIKIENKPGRRGNLVFVTVRHTFEARGEPRVVEEQDIVYRDPPQPGSSPVAATPAPADATHGFDITPDPVLLFRYSALTLNGHRIHYDRAYAQNEEGYRDLVVHGPLLATLLQRLADTACPNARLVRFTFRGMAPVFADQAFRMEAKAGTVPGDVALWVRDVNNGLAMQATATMVPR